MSNLITIRGILSYPHIFKAVPYQDKPSSELRFSCSVLIKNDDPVLHRINALIEEVKRTKWPKGMPTNKEVYCLVPYKENNNYTAIRANSKEEKRPAVIDINSEPIIDKSIAVAGKLARMCFDVYGYDGGITGGLQGVMILNEIGELGELGVVRPTTEEMFGPDPNFVQHSAQFFDDGIPTNHMPANQLPFAPVVPNIPVSPPVPQMTAKAAGATYQSFIDQGWNDQLLIQHGYVLPF